MAAPAFGFSVGDFFAAIKLLNKAAKAPREASGAKSQFQHAAVEIESIHDLLNRVQSLKSGRCSTETICKIHVCALSCHIPLARFISKLKELEPQLGNAKDSRTNQGTREKFQLMRRKLRWAFTLEGELTKLKQQLGLQFAAIGIWLQLEALESASECQESSRTTADQMKCCTESVQASLRDLKRCIAVVPVRRNTVEDEHMAIQVARQSNSNELMKVCRHTQSETAKLHADFVAVEDMLVNLKQQFCDVGRLVTIKDLPANVDDMGTIIASTDSQTQAEKPCKAEAQYTVKFLAMLGSIRQSIEKLLLMFLLLTPSFGRIYRTFQSLSRTPSLLLQDNITLEDALGRTMSLPYEHFRYWPVFLARLQSSFNGMPGEWKVKENQFRILNLRMGGEFISGSDWHRMVFPGARLAMSMVYLRDYWETTPCPLCQSASSKSPSTRWKRCDHCSLVYRSATSEERDGLVDPCTSGLDMNLDTGRRRYVVNRALQDFRRVHFLRSYKWRGSEYHRWFPSERTLSVGNIPAIAATPNALKVHFSKGDARAIIVANPFNDHALVIYPSKAACVAARDRFDGSQFRGARLKCRMLTGVW